MVSRCKLMEFLFLFKRFSIFAEFNFCLFPVRQNKQEKSRVLGKVVEKLMATTSDEECLVQKTERKRQGENYYSCAGFLFLGNKNKLLMNMVIHKI